MVITSSLPDRDETFVSDKLIHSGRDVKTKFSKKHFSPRCDDRAAKPQPHILHPQSARVYAEEKAANSADADFAKKAQRRRFALRSRA